MEQSWSRSKNKRIKVKFPKSVDKANPKLSAFLLGASQTLSTLSMLPAPSLLLPDDFKSSMSFDLQFKNIPGKNFPNRLKFKHMLPNVFRQLRFKFQIREADFVDSFKAEPSSIGSNTSNVYESFNQLLVFKVIDKEGASSLLNLMPAYHRYLSEKKFVSFLPQYCSIFKIYTDNKKSYIVVMRNIMGCSYTMCDMQTLKFLGEKEASTTTPKDPDLPDEKKNKRKQDQENIEDKKKKKKIEPDPASTFIGGCDPLRIHISEQQKAVLLDRALQDAKFLSDNGINGWKFLVASQTNANSSNIYEKTLIFDEIIMQQDESFTNPYVPSVGSVPGEAPTENPNNSNDYVKLLVPENNFFSLQNSCNADLGTSYLGCLDLSPFCKNVKRSFTNRPTKINHSKNSSVDYENASPGTQQVVKKNKSLDPEKYVCILKELFICTIFPENSAKHSNSTPQDPPAVV